jgi:mevalonate kinase
MNAWRVKVPGKVMLAGEYSVLHGEKALAATIDGYLTATIKHADNIQLGTNLWASKKSYHHLAELDIRDPFESCVANFLQNTNCHAFDLEIESELNLEYGVGSSSALRLACTYALAKYTGQEISAWDNATMSFLEQKNFQKKASGYDIATQAVGGVVQFHPESPEILDRKSVEKLNVAPEKLASIVQPMVGPEGSSTGALVLETLQWLEKENRFTELDRRNRNLIDAFYTYFSKSDNLDELILSTSQQRKFFRRAPNFPEWMAEALNVEGIDKSWSYKLTGAGGEDAVLIVGTADLRRPGEAFFLDRGWKKLPYQFTSNGLSLEEINGD